MSLHKKTLLVFGITLVGLVAIISLLSQAILGGSFKDLEERDTRLNVQRVLNAMAEDISILDATTRDWAGWDDTYTFIQDFNKAYMDSNLANVSFINNRLSLMLYINASGQTVFAKAFDLNKAIQIPVPVDLREQLAEGGLLLEHPNSESAMGGMVLLNQGPMLVSSQPILTTEREGPVWGTLIWGRYLDSKELTRLAERTRLSLTLHQFNGAQMPSDFRTALSSLSEAQPIVVRSLSGETVAGYALLQNVSKKPILVLRADLPRDIHKQGQSTRLYFISAVIAAGLVFVAVTQVLLRKLVLARLTRLSDNLSWISAMGKLSARVSVEGMDELSRLGSEVNRMLRALQHSQEEHLRAERSLAQQAVALARAEELEHSRQRVLTAQEGVRREIAAHLHGRVQGRLLAVKGRLQELLKPANPTAEMANILGEAVESMDQVIRNDLSALSRRLYPSIVRRGLVPALESLCDQFETDMEIDRALDPGLAQRERADRNLVAESVRLALYRIAEESLTNVLKHAQAKKVAVQLEVLPQGLLHLTVRDDGQGFIMDGRPPGLGLSAIQDYAEAMGGRCVVHSAPGQGTQVTATLPLLRPDAGRPE